MLIFTLIGIALFVALVFGPQLWITHTMRKHSVELPGMPGTGGELARHLLDDAGLADVKIEITTGGDHYSMTDRAVRLSPSNHGGKSITAIAVAAHEVAHAVQHRDGYLPLELRQRLVSKTAMIERIGSIVLMATPLVFAVVKSPVLLVVELGAALGIMASTIVVHLVTLPTEFDASFRKALPVLTDYVPPEEMAGARAVLRAAAFTYVASALRSLVSIMRWLRLLRF